MTPHPPAQSATGNSPSEFARGVGDIWRGFRFLLGHPALWIWAIIPFILNIGVFALVGWGAWHYFGGWLHGHLFAADSTWWMEAFGWLLGLVFWLLMAIIIFFCFVPLATLMAAPFNDLLSEKVESLYAGMGVEGAFSPGALARAITVSIKSSLRLTVLTLGLLALTLPLHLIPGVGSVLATVASSAITIRFLSLQFTSYSMDRRFYDYAQRRAFLRQNRARTIGLGAMAFLVMLAPVVNALFIPVSAVAGTLLFCDAQRR